MKKILTAICLFASICVSAQQKISSENLGKISTINIAGSLNVNYVQSDVNAIEIELHNSNLTNLEWELEDEVLSVKLKPSNKDNRFADVTIRCKDSVKTFNIGGCSFMTEGAITSPILEMNASLGAKVTAEFNSLDLTVKASSGSAIVLLGRSKYTVINVSDKSRIDARDIDVVSCDVTATMNSEAYIYVSERLNAAARHTSKIYYIGSPAILKIDNPMITGLGAEIINIE